MAAGFLSQIHPRAVTDDTVFWEFSEAYLLSKITAIATETTRPPGGAGRSCSNMDGKVTV